MWPRQVAALESRNKLPHSKIRCSDDRTRQFESCRQRFGQEINQRLRLFESTGHEGRKFLAEDEFIVGQIHVSYEGFELQIFQRLVIFGKSFGSCLKFWPANLTKAFLKLRGVEDLQKLVSM